MVRDPRQRLGVTVLIVTDHDRVATDDAITDDPAVALDSRVDRMPSVGADKFDPFAATLSWTCMSR